MPIAGETGEREGVAALRSELRGARGQDLIDGVRSAGAYALAASRDDLALDSLDISMDSRNAGRFVIRSASDSLFEDASSLFADFLPGAEAHAHQSWLSTMRLGAFAAKRDAQAATPEAALRIEGDFRMGRGSPAAMRLIADVKQPSRRIGYSFIVQSNAERAAEAIGSAWNDSYVRNLASSFAQAWLNYFTIMRTAA